MQRVALASEGPGYNALEFHGPVFDADGYFSCVATLVENGDETSVDLGMIEAYRADMLGFFEEMAAEASGWPGSKEWESESAELSIAAANAADGSARLDIEARWPPEYEERRNITLELQAAGLSHVAAQMRVFLDLPQGERFQLRPG